jgi:hypothetical protein
MMPLLSNAAAAIARPILTLPEAAQGFMDAVCNFDIEQVSAELCDDVRLSFGEELYAIGKLRVRNVFIRALGSIYSIHCEPAVVWMKRNVAIVEADVRCERLDRALVEFPLTVVLRFRDHRIAEIRLLTYEPALTGSLGVLRAGH